VARTEHGEEHTISPVAAWRSDVHVYAFVIEGVIAYAILAFIVSERRNVGETLFLQNHGRTSSRGTDYSEYTFGMYRVTPEATRNPACQVAPKMRYGNGFARNKIFAAAPLAVNMPRRERIA